MSGYAYCLWSISWISIIPPVSLSIVLSIYLIPQQLTRSKTIQKEHFTLFFFHWLTNQTTPLSVRKETVSKFPPSSSLPSCLPLYVLCFICSLTGRPAPLLEHRLHIMSTSSSSLSLFFLSTFTMSLLPFYLSLLSSLFVPV